MDESKTGMNWIVVLFVVVILYLIFGGGLGFGNGCGNRAGWNNDCGCTRVSNCEIEKQEIIDSARTQYMIEQQASNTRAATQAGFEAVMAQNSRIYEQGLQETIFDLKMKNQTLETQIFTKAQTDALAKQYNDCCCELNRRLDAIECNMLKRPALYGVASTCAGQIIPSTIANGGTVIA